jgi:hypothetical protein
MPHRVVNLGEVKDLLASLEDLRQHILKGEIRAFAVTLQGPEGKETVYLGGVYKRDYASALMAGLKQSWVVTQATKTAPP